jgi:hypothetical protein
MHVLSPKLISKLPVRIDLGWMRPHEATPTHQPQEDRSGDSPHRAILMNQILELNPSANAEFLAQFPPGSLAEYLEHLSSAAMPRGRHARRIRPANTPGVMARAAAV